MNSARKHFEWDEGFYLARTDPERIAKPRPQGEPLQLPKRVPFDGDRIVKAWAAIGLDHRKRGLSRFTVTGFKFATGSAGRNEKPEREI